MTRAELHQIVVNVFTDSEELFAYKNRSYGDDLDAFYNFREAARRIWAKNTDLDSPEMYQAMFKVLLSYMDKHYVALCNNGIQDPEVVERLRDIIVYCAIGIAMVSVANQNTTG